MGMDDPIEGAIVDDARIDQLADLMERRLAAMQADYERTIAMGGVGYTGNNIDRNGTDDQLAIAASNGTNDQAVNGNGTDDQFAIAARNETNDQAANSSDDDAPYLNGASEGYVALGNGAPYGYAVLGSDDEGSDIDETADVRSDCNEGGSEHIPERLADAHGNGSEQLSGSSGSLAFQPPPRYQTTSTNVNNSAHMEDASGLQANGIGAGAENSRANSPQDLVCASGDEAGRAHLEDFADFGAFPEAGEVGASGEGSAAALNWPNTQALSTASECGTAVDADEQQDAQTIRETMQRIRPSAPAWAGNLTDEVLQRMIQDAMKSS